MKRALPVAVVVLAALALTTPGTASKYAATIGNTADTAATKSGFACADVLKSPAADGVSALFVWPLTEASGTSAADISGHGSNGTYSGGSSSTAAPPAPPCPRDAVGANWRSFTGGASGNYVYSSAGQTVSSTTPFSLEVWIKTTTANQGLAGLTNSSGAISVSLSITTGGGVQFAPTAAASVSSTGSVIDGNWHEIVATFDPVAGHSAAGSRIYVDGALVAQGTSTAAPSGSSQFWEFGAGSPSSPPSGFVKYYTGGMRYVSVYPLVLTQTQVTTHYSAGTGG